MMRPSQRNDERRICRMKEEKNKRSFPQGRKKKRDPGLLSFLNTYHKTMWIAKYNCTFVYEDDGDDAEIGEEVTSVL